MCPLAPLSFHVPHQPTQTIPSGTHEQGEEALLLMDAWVAGSSLHLPYWRKSAWPHMVKDASFKQKNLSHHYALD